MPATIPQRAARLALPPRDAAAHRRRGHASRAGGLGEALRLNGHDLGTTIGPAACSVLTLRAAVHIIAAPVSTRRAARTTLCRSMNTLAPAVAASLTLWHDMVARRDLSRLSEITHPNAVFRSPVAHTPYQSAAVLTLALTTVMQVFEEFTYHRQLATDDGLSVIFEFAARVGDRQLKGIDLIRFDADGKIVDFEVMVRPLSGLQALGAEMGKRLGHLLPNYKG
jgi:hypothetical protein